MNTRIKGWQKLVITVTGLLVLLVVGLVVGTPWLFNGFVESLKPDAKEEANVIEQAEQYLQMKYPDMKYEISYVFYDSGEDNGNYDYDVTGSVEGEKSAINNVHHRLFNVYIAK